MSEVTCGICLDDLKSPVSTPCGHLHCKKCMYEHVKSSTDAVRSPCPTCRTPFYTVNLDPTFVPEKYHPFVIPALRRVYLNTDPSRTSATSRKLQEQLTALKKENEDLTSKLKGRDRDMRLLMTKCESSIAAATAHAKGERDARLESERLRHEMNQLVERYRTLQVRFSEREHQTGEDEGKPIDDPRQSRPRRQSRFIPDPLKSVDANGRSVNAGNPRSAPTAINKRKYAASTTSASLSLSSPVSSSTPSSPALDVEHKASNPVERSLLQPWRRRMVKRPRLDPEQSGGGDVNAPLRQTLAPPPIFTRRRPSTPFNRSPGETSVAAGDQAGLERAEGSGYDTDDSLNLSMSRRR